MKTVRYVSCILIFFLLLAFYETAFAGRIQMIHGIEYIAQSDDNYCGAAALAMLMNFWAKDKAYRELAIVDEIYNERKKMIYNSDMVFFANREKFPVRSFNSHIYDLKKLIDQGIPVIVLQKPVKRIKKGHYRVVFGYDDYERVFFIHDPILGPNRGIKYDEFVELWNFGENINRQNWALAIIPDEEAPLVPELMENRVFHLNMAAAYYRRKAYEDSVESWKKAIAISDVHAMPYYCLAQVLLDMDEPDRALPFAIKAVELDSKDPFGYDVLGLAYFRKGMFFEAAEAMIQAVHLTENRHAFILKHWQHIRKSYIQFKKNEGGRDALAS